MRRSLSRSAALLASLALCLGILGSPVVRAGHTLPAGVGGDCWRSGTPLWCRTTWITDHIVHLRYVNQFTNERPNWYDNATTACDAWHNYVVPPTGHPDIRCHWASGSLDTLVYWKKASPALPSGVYALTYNCNTSGVCSSSGNQSMNVWYSEVHMNYTEMDKLPDVQVTMLFAHETGHTLGLYHHSGSYLMNPSPNNLTGPTATDYGQKPPCSGAYSTYGVRCVFDLTD